MSSRSIPDSLCSLLWPLQAYPAALQTGGKANYLIPVKAAQPEREEDVCVDTVLETTMSEERTAPAGIAGSQSPLPKGAQKRLAREWKTVVAMVHCYCRHHHRVAAGGCLECQQLLDYAALRLERCRFGADKPTCARCPVHCYQRYRRDQIKAVMKYAGPRMLWQHPLLSLRHWLDGFRKAPPVTGGACGPLTV